MDDRRSRGEDVLVGDGLADQFLRPGKVAMGLPDLKLQVDDLLCLLVKPGFQGQQCEGHLLVHGPHCNTMTSLRAILCPLVDFDLSVWAQWTSASENSRTLQLEHPRARWREASPDAMRPPGPL